MPYPPSALSLAPAAQGVLAPRLLLALSVLFGPVAILLAGHDRWDGVGFSYLISSNRLGVFDDLFDAGQPFAWFVVRTQAWLTQQLGLNYWWTAKTGMAMLMLWISWESWRLALDVLRFERRWALWTAALVLVFPGYMLFHQSPHVNYGLFLCLALAGYRLIRGDDRGWPVVGAVLVFLSFQLNSLMLLVPALELARLLVAGQLRRGHLRNLLVLLVLSVLGYLFWRVGIRTVGIWAAAGYNQVLWPTSTANLKRLVEASALWGTWLVMLAQIPLFWVLLRRVPGEQADRSADSAAGSALAARQLGAGLILCVAAAAPYAVAGKYAAFFVPTFFGPSNSVYAAFQMEFHPGLFFSGLATSTTRHSIVMGVTLSLALVACARWVVLRFPARTLAPDMGAAYLLALVWLHQSLWTLWAHGQIFRSAVLEQALVQAYKAMPAPPEGATVLVERHEGQKAWTGHNETAHLLYLAYGRAAWIAGTVFAPDGPSYRATVDLLERNKADIARWRPLRDFKDLPALNLAGDFVDNGCTVHYVFQLAEPSLTDMLWRMPTRPATIAPARLISREQSCHPIKGIP